MHLYRWPTIEAGLRHFLTIFRWSGLVDSRFWAYKQKKQSGFNQDSIRKQHEEISD
jgi:hypothetical protein